MKYAGALFLAVCVIVLPVEVSGAKKNAKSIAGRVKKTLEKVKTFQCAFERSYYIKAGDRTTRFSGTFHMKKPYLLRVEYPAQTIVVDGEAVWVYVPKNKQVRISQFIQDKDSFPTPYSIFEKYSKDSKIEWIGEEKINGYECSILELVSDSPGEVSVKVWIDRKLNFPVKTIETYPSGDSIQFVLKVVVLNEKIDDGIFKFATPEGVEIVDLRE